MFLATLVDGLQYMRQGPPTKLRCAIPAGVGVDHPLTIRLPAMQVETTVRFSYCPPIVDDVHYQYAAAFKDETVTPATAEDVEGGGENARRGEADEGGCQAEDDDSASASPGPLASGVPTQGGVIVLTGQVSECFFILQYDLFLHNVLMLFI